MPQHLKNNKQYRNRYSNPVSLDLEISIIVIPVLEIETHKIPKSH